MTTESTAAPRPYHDVPGPRGLPLIGVARDLLRDPFTLFEEITAAHGGLVRLPIPGQKTFLLSDPELIKFALLDNTGVVTKPVPLLERVDIALGKGLVTSVGETWRRNRRIINPVFARDRIQRLEPTIQAAARDTVDRWRGAAEIDLRSEMARTMLELVLEGLFSGSPLATSKFDQIAESLMVLLRFVTRLFMAAIPYDLYLPTPVRLRALWHRRRIDRIIDEMIEHRAEGGEADILSQLVDARDPETGAALSRSEVLDEARTAFLAGYETTATALFFAFLLLSRHPAAREEMEAELDRVLGGRMPTVADLAELPYTMQVFHETLRLYPSAWVIGRALAKPATLGGYRLPAGAQLHVSPWATHRSARNWPDPLRFDPSRFAPENRGAIHKFAYIPFGGGARKCIGTHLALLEGPMLLAGIAQHFRVDEEPGQTLRLGGGVAIDVLAGTRFRVTPRGG